VQNVWPCIAICAALSLVTALMLSRPGGQASTFGALPRLLIVGAPGYLAVNYVIYQGVATSACAAATFAFGLYVLRDWWFPEHLAPGLKPRRGASMPDSPAALVGSEAVGSVRYFVARDRRTEVASAALRHRMLVVVRDDRAGERHMRHAA
jgi:hypothetical protein